MPELTKKHLLTLTAALSLSGCDNAPSVSNPSPAPYFASCETIKAVAGCEQPEALLRDMIGMTNVMEKLRERQPDHERDQFIRCEFAIPKCD